MKYSSKVAALCISAAFATGFAFADGDIPTVTEVSMQQGPGNRIVTIKYKLDSYPAVVTLDVKTNDTVSIGGEHIWNAEGAVWRKVTSADADGSGWCTITWDPTQSWKDGNGNGFKAQDVKAEVTAWPLDNTPDYMVVDISDAAQPNTQRYYPAVDFLPGSELGQVGAVTNNPIYKGSALLMRKIMAKGIKWTMGSAPFETQRNDAREATHLVTLTNNYYIGVYEVTQTQWGLVQTNRPLPSAIGGADRLMRPVENVSYNEIRNAANSTTVNTAYNWPDAPNPGSFLGLLRSRTGLDVDLPSEAQWEFAARAGNGSTKWGDGSGIKNDDIDTNLNLLGCYSHNREADADGYTAIVGSYAPNSWGLYDVHGNVYEWCLDWFEADIATAKDASGEEYGGRVNIDPSNSANFLSGASASGIGRMIRGGAHSDAAGKSRPACRSQTQPDTRGDYIGFRIVCTAGLR